MPKAYWIARVDVSDPERYADYSALAGPAIAAHGGRFLVRGGGVVALEGEARRRNVVVEFADMAAARACYDSAAYREARTVRLAASDADVVMVEGVD